MTRRKNGFLLFCFSMLPGAGEMYLGFMKMGVSLMGMFWAIIAIAGTLNIGSILFLMPILWFYSFFHAHNLAGLPDTEYMNIQDDFLFNIEKILNIKQVNIEKYRKLFSGILILIGIILLWQGFIDTCYYFLPDMVVNFLHRIGYTLPRMIVGALIIMGGYYMIKGKHIQLQTDIIEHEEYKEKTEEKYHPMESENTENTENIVSEAEKTDQFNDVKKEG